MILVAITALVAVCSAAKLDRTYLPPASAKTAGGAPGSLQTPFAGNSLNNGLGGLPKGSYTNDFQGVVVDAALAGTRASESGGTGLGAPRISYGSTDSKVGGAAFKVNQAGFRQPTDGSQAGFNQADTQAEFSQGAQVALNQAGINQPGVQAGFNQAANNQFGSQAAFNAQASQPERPRASLDRTASTLRFENEIGPETYNYAYETDNGIAAEENGVTKNGVQAQGAYSYTGDDGQVYSVTYTADEGGYQPKGDHLPTPPPIPEEILKSLEKNARDEAAGLVDDGSYDAQKYNAGNDYAESDSANGKINHQSSKFGNRPEADATASGTFINQNNQPFRRPIAGQPNFNQAGQSTSGNAGLSGQGTIGFSASGFSSPSGQTGQSGHSNEITGPSAQGSDGAGHIENESFGLTEQAGGNAEESSNDTPVEPLAQEYFGAAAISGNSGASSIGIGASGAPSRPSGHGSFGTTGQLGNAGAGSIGNGAPGAPGRPSGHGSFGTSGQSGNGGAGFFGNGSPGAPGRPSGQTSFGTSGQSGNGGVGSFGNGAPGAPGRPSGQGSFGVAEQSGNGGRGSFGNGAPGAPGRPSGHGSLDTSGQSGNGGVGSFGNSAPGAPGRPSGHGSIGTSGQFGNGGAGSFGNGASGAPGRPSGHGSIGTSGQSGNGGVGSFGNGAPGAPGRPSGQGSLSIAEQSGNGGAGSFGNGAPGAPGRLSGHGSFGTSGQSGNGGAGSFENGAPGAPGKPSGQGSFVTSGFSGSHGSAGHSGNGASIGQSNNAFKPLSNTVNDAQTGQSSNGFPNNNEYLPPVRGFNRPQGANPQNGRPQSQKPQGAVGANNFPVYDQDFNSNTQDSKTFIPLAQQNVQDQPRPQRPSRPSSFVKPSSNGLSGQPGFNSPAGIKPSSNANFAQSLQSSQSGNGFGSNNEYLPPVKNFNQNIRPQNQPQGANKVPSQINQQLNNGRFPSVQLNGQSQLSSISGQPGAPGSQTSGLSSFKPKPPTLEPDTELTTPLETSSDDASINFTSDTQAHTGHSQFTTQFNKKPNVPAPTSPSFGSRPQRPGNSQTQASFPTQHTAGQLNGDAQFGNNQPQPQNALSQNAQDVQYSPSTQRPSYAQQPQGPDDSYYYNQPSKPFGTPNQGSRFPSPPSNQFDRVNQRPSFPQNDQSSTKYPRPPTLAPATSSTPVQLQGNAVTGITQASISAFPSESPTQTTQFNAQGQFGRPNYQQSTNQLGSPAQPGRPFLSQQSPQPSFGQQTTASSFTQRPSNAQNQPEFDDPTAQSLTTSQQYNSEIYEYKKPAQSLPVPTDKEGLSGSGQFGQQVESQTDSESTKPHLGHSSDDDSHSVTTTQFGQQNMQAPQNTIPQFGAQPSRPFGTQPSQIDQSSQEPQTNDGSRPQFNAPIGRPNSCCQSSPQFGQRPTSLQRPQGFGGQNSRFKGSQSFKPEPTTNSFAGKGEVFGGPRNPPSFDDQTGYHY